MSHPRTIEGDWFDGAIPENVVIDESAHVETSFSFHCFRSRQSDGLRLGRAAAVYGQTVFDVGPDGRVSIGEFTLLSGARLVCDRQITIGSYCMFAWNVCLLDSRRMAQDPALRRQFLEQAIANEFNWPERTVDAQPIVIADNVWVGFDSVVLPGVTIGEGSVIGARSVVYTDIPPYSVAVGNPARVVRSLPPTQEAHHE